MDMINEQVEAYGNPPYPKVVCVTGNNSMLRSLVAETLNVHFTREYQNSIPIYADRWQNGYVYGFSLSDQTRDKVGISKYQTVDCKKLADICTSEKKINELEDATWESTKGYVDKGIDEGGHYTLILSGTTLPDRDYWKSGQSYRILIDSPDKTNDDASVDYSGAEPDIVIHSIDEFNRESGNIIKAINEKESYGVEGRRK